MADTERCLVLLQIFVLFCSVCGLPEQGIWTKTMDKDNNIVGVTKSAFNATTIVLNVECKEEATVTVEWILRWTPCAEEYIGIERDKTRLEYYLSKPDLQQVNLAYEKVKYQRYKESGLSCSKSSHLVLPDLSEKEYQIQDMVMVNQTAMQKDAIKGNDGSASRKKRAPDGEIQTGDGKNPTDKAGKDATATQGAKQQKEKKKTQDVQKGKTSKSKFQIASTWEDGIYLLVVRITSDPENDKFSSSATIKMEGPTGYLSAIEWPLLPFYGVMCIVYVIFGLVWLVLAMCNWRDLLRIQFWIGGVIFLGELEKAVFFAEYESINSTGNSVRGAVVFAELVSCMKRTLARILVVIVSLGFGIVKPRLGPMLHRVLGMGALYFILASVEGCLRVLKPKGDVSNQQLLASIPLAVLDAAICWWIFTSLVQTTRTLRLRRNVVKLSLYRHFTNTLIFAVLASVAFMIWSIKQHKLANCLTDWKEIWVDDAFWHLLFSLLLLIIMILWRPTINNQRYAFSPLLDSADDEMEEDENTLSDAFDGMKSRGRQQVNGSPKQKDEKNKTEEDLKWIEDNIPASVADTALPSLLDSDEEIMTTKFEMSKME